MRQAATYWANAAHLEGVGVVLDIDGGRIDRTPTNLFLVSNGAAGSLLVPPELLSALTELHDGIRDEVRAQAAASTMGLADPQRLGPGDVSYGIDLPAEELVDRIFGRLTEPTVVVCEGIGTRTYPRAGAASAAKFRVVIDPLDGSRELMYDKRSAFVLSGVAVERGEQTTLADVFFGLMTEVPPQAQRLGVRLSAYRGRGASCETWDLDQSSMVVPPVPLRTSTEPTIRGGYAPFVHYFPGTHAAVGALADEVLLDVLRSDDASWPQAFDDCYISTGGQLYLLASGRYRLLVDARPALGHSGSSFPKPLCAHPYDLAGPLLVAEEAGALVTSLGGGPVMYQLDTETDCGFIAYANASVKAEVQPALERALTALSLRVAIDPVPRSTQ
jgi:fructose-1,6-bisphosphatase/inositol monophosphatase family enzyme